MSRKRKLEAGLAGLFSTSKKRARPQEPVATDAAASVPEHTEAVPPEVEQPEAGQPAPEQPVVAIPAATEGTASEDRSEPSGQMRVATNEHEEQQVIFTLAHEHYGVDISAVESIIKMQPITAVPRAPSFVEGLTNLRGAVLPVIDLHQRFGLPAEEKTKETRIVVVEINGMTVGMVVDGVSEVLSVTEEDIEPPSPIVMTIDSAFITGIAKVDDRLIILLDLGKVLSTGEHADLQAFSAG